MFVFAMIHFGVQNRLITDPCRCCIYKNNSATLLGTCQTPTEPEIFLFSEATYPLYMLGDYIITDTGTGPSGRVLSAYNLLTQEEVFQKDTEE